jgi:hypothetical protein
LPDYLPGDFAALNFKVMAVEHPEIALAFDFRNVNRQAAAAELRQVEAALRQLQRNSLADPKMVASLNEHGVKLRLALNSPEILRRAAQEVARRAQAVPRSIDAEATADRESVAAAVRSAGGRVAVEPAPQLGTMSNNELRKWTRDNFGFDPLL